MAFSNEDILTLAKAGFNAQQIAALNIVGTAPAPAPAPELPAPELPAPAPAPEPQPAPAPAPAPDPVPAPAPAPEPPAASIDDVLKAVAGISDAIKIGNLQSMQQPKPVTAEDILAEIINPPTKDKN